MCSMGSESSTWPKSWERVASGRVLPLRVTRALSSMAERIRGWGGLMLACAEQNTRPDDNVTRAPKLRLFLDIWTSLGEYLRLGNTSRTTRAPCGREINGSMFRAFLKSYHDRRGLARLPSSTGRPDLVLNTFGSFQQIRCTATTRQDILEPHDLSI